MPFRCSVGPPQPRPTRPPFSFLIFSSALLCISTTPLLLTLFCCALSLEKIWGVTLFQFSNSLKLLCTVLIFQHCCIVHCIANCTLSLSPPDGSTVLPRLPGTFTVAGFTIVFQPCPAPSLGRSNTTLLYCCRPQHLAGTMCGPTHGSGDTRCSRQPHAASGKLSVHLN